MTRFIFFPAKCRIRQRESAVKHHQRMMGIMGCHQGCQLVNGYEGGVVWQIYLVVKKRVNLEFYMN